MSTQELTGQTIGGYKLLELFGEGGMGAVYRARQETLDREVAFKVISHAVANRTEYMQRFYQEARLSAALEHANIVPIHDYGTIDDITYVTMRLLKGGSLAERIQGQKLKPKTVAVVLRQLASALDYAHSKGVVHRDIKPNNIIFDEQNSPYLVDFGIAKLLGETKGLTASGALIGTPTHMPPEQWRGEDITGASDQYALGIVVYEMLTGTLPFDAPTPYGLMLKHMNDEPPSLEDVGVNLSFELSEDIGNVLEVALAKDPADRYPTVMAFADAFETAVHRAEAGNAPSSTPPFGELHVQSTRAGVEDAAEMVPPRGDGHDTHLLGQQARAGTTMPNQRTLIEWVSGTLSMVTRGSRLLAAVLLAAIIGAMAFAVVALRPPAPESEVSGAPAEAPAAAPLPTPTSTFRAAQQITSLSDTMLPWIRDIDYLPDGSRVATASTDGSIQIWDWDVALSAAEEKSPEIVLFDNFETGSVLSIDYNDAGTFLASGYADGFVRTWMPDRNQTLPPICHETNEDGETCKPTAVFDVAYNPAEPQQLASAGTDGTVRLWLQALTQAPQPLMTYADGESAALSLAFSPDGTLLAVGYADGSIRLWDVVVGDLLDTRAEHAGAVWSLAFSPPGDRVVSGSEDQTVRLWGVSDTPSLEIIHEMRGHTDAVLAVAFSQNAQVFPASVGADQTIRFWDMATGTPLVEYQDERIVSNMLSLAFRPDDTAFAFGCSSNAGTWGIFGWTNVLDDEGEPQPDALDDRIELAC